MLGGADGVAEDGFFQAGEGLGAEAADGAGGDFEHPDAARIDAHFGVNGAVGEAESGDGGGDGFEDRRLDSGGVARRGDVDGFLKVRAVERVGFVEEGEGAEAAMGDDAFEGELAAGEEFLHLDEAVLGAMVVGDFGGEEQGADAFEGGAEFGGIVGADDAAAGGEAERFEDAGEGGAGGCGREIGVEGQAEKVGDGEAGGAETLAGEEFIGGGGDGGGGVEGKAEGFGGERGDEGRVVANGGDAGDEGGIGGGGNGAGGGLRVFEAEGESGVAPGIVEDVAAVGGEGEFDAAAEGGFGEGSGLIAGGGGDEEDAGHATRAEMNFTPS